MPNYVSDRESAQEKHRTRRAEIIAAAADVMSRQGVSACTVRAVAKRADVSPGVIHYYFVDTQELVDLGYEWITDRYFGALERMRHTHDDPSSDFWHFIAAYVEPWNAHPRMTQLWSEYHLLSGRNQRMDGVVVSHQRTIAAFESFLSAVGDGPWVKRGASAWRYISGTVETRQAMPIELQEIFDDLGGLIGLPIARVADVLCARQDCWCRGGAPRLFG